jgi:hypothetical protein
LKVRSLFLSAIAAIVLASNQSAVASPVSAIENYQTPATTEVQPFVNTSFKVTARCPVERIRDTNIVGIITDHGKTRQEAAARANARVFAEYGIGYRLHHCTYSSFSGAGGSSSW